jgi:uncharacterized protein YjiS (DUF1127 family)
MKNENRAVFDRGPEPIDYALDLPTDPSRDAGEGSLQPAPENFIIRLLAAIIMRWRGRRQRAALLELSDEQLKDIGISRCQAYGGYSRYSRNGSHGLERRCR